jgi:hypothetical protein
MITASAAPSADTSIPHRPANNPKADVIMEWESRVCEFAPDSPPEESGFELLVPLAPKRERCR